MELLPQTVWVIGLVFARVGALMMLAPGIGDQFVPARARLMVALFIAFTLAPVVSGKIAPLPSDTADMFLAIAKEILIGLSLGLKTCYTLAGSECSIQLNVQTRPS